MSMGQQPSLPAPVAEAAVVSKMGARRCCRYGHGCKNLRNVTIACNANLPSGVTISQTTKAKVSNVVGHKKELTAFRSLVLQSEA